MGEAKRVFGFGILFVVLCVRPCLLAGGIRWKHAEEVNFFSDENAFIVVLFSLLEECFFPCLKGA